MERMIIFSTLKNILKSFAHGQVIEAFRLPVTHDDSGESYGFVMHLENKNVT